MSWLRGPGISVKVAVGYCHGDRGALEVCTVDVTDVDLIDPDEWHSETTAYPFDEGGVRAWLDSEDGIEWLAEAIEHDRKNP